MGGSCTMATTPFNPFYTFLVGMTVHTRGG